MEAVITAIDNLIAAIDAVPGLAASSGGWFHNLRAALLKCKEIAQA